LYKISYKYSLINSILKFNIKFSNQSLEMEEVDNENENYDNEENQ